MAITNIFNEPRREITETLVGLFAGTAIFVPFGYCTHLVALMLQRPETPTDAGTTYYIALIFALLMMIIAVIGVGFIVFVLHELGEWACDKLEDFNIHLRPRERY